MTNQTPVTDRLIALVTIAENLENSISRLSQDTEWEKRGATVMGYLMLSQEAYQELVRDAREMLADTTV
jgi:hypothetical protein